MEGSHGIDSDGLRELLRALCDKNGRPKTLADIIVFLGAIERTGISKAELEAGLGALISAGLAKDVGGRWMPTAEGQSVPNSYEDRAELAGAGPVDSPVSISATRWFSAQIAVFMSTCGVLLLMFVIAAWLFIRWLKS